MPRGQRRRGERMTNGSWRTALYALLLTLGLVVVSAPSEAQNATTEDAVGSFLTMTNNRAEAGPAALPVAGGGTSPLLPVLPVYVARRSEERRVGKGWSRVW